MSFASKTKSISYSASFSVDKIDDSIKPVIKDLLSDFQHISVREEAGMKLIKDMLNINVPVLVDPTLLLTKVDWLKISKPNLYKPQKKYILTYFLGKEINKHMRFIKKYAEDNNYTIVNLGTVKDPKRFVIDPSEFIDYFNNASMIFTDSFHGSVFSIIFKKPFVVFKRGNMNSRIDTLLSKFNLENRHWDYVEEHNNFNDIDYSHVDEIINEERKKSFDYLRNALGIKKEE